MIKVAAENTSIGEILKQLEVFNEYKEVYSGVPSSLSFTLDPKGIPCFHYTQVNEINSHSSPIVFVDMISEGASRLKVVKEYQKNKKYIIFANGWWDRNNYDIDLDYELIPWNIFFFDLLAQISSSKCINYYAKEVYHYGKKPHLFCSLIGTAKKSRDFFVETLTKTENTSYILNYNGNELGLSCRELDINYNFNEYNSYRNVGRTCEYSISYSIPVNMYNSCYFNLVVESSIDLQHEFHLTEKTIKPIIAGIPFVLMSGPFYLKRLRELGYKTFNSLWSENYDEIEDFQERACAVVDLVKKLQDFDWHKHTEELKSITDHNRLNLLYNNSLLKSQLTNVENVLLDLSNQGY